jgi:ABC-type multidrug transport system permease subunit
LNDYIKGTGGYLLDTNATTDCSFCSLSDTNTFLSQVSSYYSQRWRNFGLLFAYIAFNVAGAIFFYWLVRVPKNSKKKVKKE